MTRITLPAHFDGKQIVLDASYALEPDTRLLVTVLSDTGVDDEQQDWHRLSASGLSRAYAENEVDYAAHLVKASNLLSVGPLRELEFAALRVDLPAHGLVAGDVGTIVLVHRDGDAYEVEFVAGDGQTIAVETLEAANIVPVTGRHILHLRPLPPAA